MNRLFAIKTPNNEIILDTIGVDPWGNFYFEYQFKVKGDPFKNCYFIESVSRKARKMGYKRVEVTVREKR